MKEVPKYITSIQIQANEMRNINISLGFEKNGAMMLNFQDTAELEQDSSYLNEAAYPNSAVMVYGSMQCGFQCLQDTLPVMMINQVR